MRSGDVRAALALDTDEPMRGMDKARPPHRQRRFGRVQLTENLIGDSDELHRRIVRQIIGKLAHEKLQRLVHGAAALQRADRGVQRFERRQPQHPLGVDRVGIAQPGLDLGDGEFARPCLNRRARGRALHAFARDRFVQRPGDGNIICRGRQRVFEVQTTRQLHQPLQPARSDSRRAIRFERAQQDRIGLRRKRGEVMRRKADGALRRLQADRLSHRARKPRIVRRRTRPRTLVEARHHHQIEAQ